MRSMMGIVQTKRTSQDVVLGYTPNSNSKPDFVFKPFRLIFETCSRGSCFCQENKVKSPKARSGHRIVCDDVNAYSFGGYNPSLSDSDELDLADSAWPLSKPLFKELWKYNIPTKTWKKLDVEHIPDILASNAVILSGNMLLVFGGTGIPFGANCSKDLYICNLKNDNKLEFTLVQTTGDCPQPRYGQAIVLLNHFLYTIGGTTGFEYSCDVHRLNLKDGVWEAVYICKGTDSEPQARYRHEVVLYSGKIFILGGGTSQEVFPFQVIFAFDLSTSQWEKVWTRPDNKTRSLFPSPRRCHSCVQMDNHCFIIGGYNGRTMFKDIWRLDMNTFQWVRFPRFSLSQGTYFHSSCLTSNGKLINFGGIVHTDNSSRRSCSVHTAWLKIPKLKEMCWEALMYYVPDLDLLPTEELLTLGLPHEFIARLQPPSS